MFHRLPEMVDHGCRRWKSANGDGLQEVMVNSPFGLDQYHKEGQDREHRTERKINRLKDWLHSKTYSIHA
jgi:hypothetical protein